MAVIVPSLPVVMAAVRVQAAPVSQCIAHPDKQHRKGHQSNGATYLHAYRPLDVHSHC